MPMQLILQSRDGRQLNAHLLSAGAPLRLEAQDQVYYRLADDSGQAPPDVLLQAVGEDLHIHVGEEREIILQGYYRLDPGGMANPVVALGTDGQLHAYSVSAPLEHQLAAEVANTATASPPPLAILGGIVGMAVTGAVIAGSNGDDNTADNGRPEQPQTLFDPAPPAPPATDTPHPPPPAMDNDNAMPHLPDHGISTPPPSGGGHLPPSPVNHAPTDIALDKSSIPEGQDGAVVGTLTTTDPDQNDTHTYTVSDARFEVVNGKLKLKAGQILNYDDAQSLNLSITSRDAAGDSVEKTFTLTVQDDPSYPPNSPPTGAVKIDGRAVAGQVLSADTSTLHDADGLGLLTYQWQADGINIHGATARTYLLSDSDVGKHITVTVNYLDGKFKTESVTSAATAPVDGGNVPLPQANATIAIAGEAKTGQTLTATITDPDSFDAATVQYQWFADGQPIANARQRTYTLTDAEKGKAISVQASYTDNAKVAEHPLSAPTDAVLDDGVPTALPVLTLTGSRSLKEGEAGNYTLHLDKAADRDVTVDVDIRHISSNDSNVQAHSRTLTIARGTTSLSFDVDTLQNLQAEDDKTFALILKNPQGAVLADGAPSDPSQGSGGVFADMMDESFTAAGQNGTYRLYGQHLAGVQKPVGLMVYLHGDGAGEFLPGSTTLRAYADKARENNVLMLAAKTPDSATMTWWQDGQNTGQYLSALIAEIQNQYNIDKGNIWLVGYSGGAELISHYLLPQHHDLFGGGGALMIGGGGSHAGLSFATPPSAALKENFRLHWLVGERDSPAQGGADGGFDALAASQRGLARYLQEGFVHAGREIISGADHYQSNVPYGPDKLDDLLESGAASAWQTRIMDIDTATNHLLHDDFSTYTLGSTYDENEQFGAWSVGFTGYGHVKIVDSGNGNHALELKPRAVSGSNANTSATLVVGPYLKGDLEYRGKIATTAQLRQNAQAEDWETAWIVWNYTDDAHFYYFIPKANGWELGKRDPAYSGGLNGIGGQRFLATGDDGFPLADIKQFHVIQQGNTMTVRINGREIVTFSDTERPYTEGRIGLYSEDAAVIADDIVVDGTLSAAPPANRAPTDIDLDNATIAEGKDGIAVGTLTTTDPDQNDTHTYTVSDARFEVANGVLKLKTGEKIEYATAPRITLNITTDDGKGGTYQESFTLAVQDDPAYPAPAPQSGKEAGLNLDVARHFYSAETLKHFIDDLARYGGTFLHLHLSDTENYALESALLGQTTANAIQRSDGVYINPLNGKPFLSTAQIQDIIAHAQSKGIAVIPEIDAPAHMKGIYDLVLAKEGMVRAQALFDTSLDADYPELYFSRTDSVDFIKALYAEVIRAFQGGGDYFHIGGDEFAVAPGENHLYISYANAMAAFLREHGLKTRMWNDGALKADLDRLDKHIEITYWSIDGNRGNAAQEAWNRTHRAGVQALLDQGFTVLNYNDAHLYHAPSDRDIPDKNVEKSADTSLFSRNDGQRILGEWHLGIWDEQNTDNAVDPGLLKGAALSIWGEHAGNIDGESIRLFTGSRLSALIAKTHAAADSSGRQAAELEALKDSDFAELVQDFFIDLKYIDDGQHVDLSGGGKDTLKLLNEDILDSRSDLEIFIHGGLQSGAAESQRDAVELDGSKWQKSGEDATYQIYQYADTRLMIESDIVIHLI